MLINIYSYPVITRWYRNADYVGGCARSTQWRAHPWVIRHARQKGNSSPSPACERSNSWPVVQRNLRDGDRTPAWWGARPAERELVPSGQCQTTQHHTTRERRTSHHGAVPSVQPLRLLTGTHGTITKKMYTSHAIRRAKRAYVEQYSIFIHVLAIYYY